MTESTESDARTIPNVKRGNLTPEMLADWHDSRGMCWPMKHVVHIRPGEGSWSETWAGPTLLDGVPYKRPSR